MIVGSAEIVNNTRRNKLRPIFGYIIPEFSV